MRIEDFQKHLAEEFISVEAEKFSPDANLMDVLGWSSLNILLVRAKIKAQYNVDLNDADIKRAKTIRDLFAITEKHVV